MDTLSNFLLLVLISITRYDGVHSYADGAPNSEKICETMRPKHSDAEPQVSTPPYIITVNDSSDPIKKGLLDVTIAGKNKEDTFKGFLIREELKDSHDNKLQGTFLNGDDYKIINCGSEGSKVRIIYFLVNEDKRYTASFGYRF